jgi:ribosomal protein S18 acetylase RimI-like enzyme
VGPAEVVILTDTAAFERIGAQDVVAVTRAATGSTFFRDDLTPEQLERNRHIVAISGETARAAAANDHQNFAAAFVDGALAGFVIATRQGPDDHELDWLMVSPEHHGSAVAPALMAQGMAWLGAERPIWLTVIRFNERAIRFYRRFGFEIDPDAPITGVHANWIMRRPGALLASS